jgi:hypothetical protein
VTVGALPAGRSASAAPGRAFPALNGEDLDQSAEVGPGFISEKSTVTGVYCRADGAPIGTFVGASAELRVLDATGTGLTLFQTPSGGIQAISPSWETRMSFPIYILDLGDKEYTIVFPEGKADIDHSDFWEATAARIVAKHLRLPLEELVNLPYCQRRARINDKNVYYGEKTSKKLLRQIEKAVGETGLRFVYDEHERRLEYDVRDFTSLGLR